MKRLLTAVCLVALSASAQAQSYDPNARMRQWEQQERELQQTAADQRTRIYQDETRRRLDDMEAEQRRQSVRLDPYPRAQ